MDKKVIVVLAEGFEETETIVPIDILRRSGVEVIIAGLGSKTITGGHGVSINTDIVFEGYKGIPDAVILPGGMPGAENLASSVEVKDFVVKMNAEKKIVAAICASPAIVLGPLGVLKDKKATCFPGMEKSFLAGINFVEDKVVQDGNIITSRGVGTALEFAIKIVETLVGKNKADIIAEQVLHND